MNYIKKIKSIGFKKIKPMVVCTYEYDTNNQGFYIETLSNALKNNEKKNMPTFLRVYKRDFAYPIVSSEYYRISTYIFNISEDVALYLIILGVEYTLVIKDNRILDFYEKRTKITHKMSITVPINSEKFSENFWKKIFGILNKDIQREILIKEICKFR